MNDQLPSQEEALELLSKSGCSPQVIEHCKTVALIATQIAKACQAKGLNVDANLVKIGALLHDIGRSRTHTVDHVIQGVEIAKSYGLPQPVISIIERHAGGGISLQEANKLGWPLKSYIPQTLEEKMVTYADKLVEGRNKLPIQRSIRKLSRDLGEKHPSVRRLRELHRSLSILIGDCDASSDPA